MINNGWYFIRDLRNTPEKRILFENFSVLSLLQVANHVFPLITLPYLVRVLGPEKFGLVSFAQALVQYFNILTDYGFNLSATREISIHRHDLPMMSRIFSAVLIIKTSLLIVSLGILAGLLIGFPKFGSDAIVYIFAFGMVIGNVLFPQWFFQGMERMRYITILNVGSKLIFTILVFVCIRREADYLYVPLLISVGHLVAGLGGIIIAVRKFKICLKFPEASFLRNQLYEGWHIFLSSVSISLYTVTNMFILGLLTNNTYVGYFSAAERLVKAVQRLFQPVSQTVYPHIIQLASKSKTRALLFIRKTLLLVGGGGIFISMIFFVFAGPIVRIILGPQYEASVIVMRILAFLPFIVALSNVFGIQTMLPFDRKKAFSKILISAGVINILLAFILVPPWKHVGISFAMLTTEIFVTIAMAWYLHVHNILPMSFVLKKHKH